MRFADQDEHKSMMTVNNLDKNTEISERPPRFVTSIFDYAGARRNSAELPPRFHAASDLMNSPKKIKYLPSIKATELSTKS